MASDTRKKVEVFKAATSNSHQKKNIETKIQRLDQQINQLNSQLCDITEQLACSEIYEEQNQAKLKELLATRTNVQKKLELAETEWLSLNEQLENS